MTTIFTKRKLEPGDEIAVYAPKSEKGDEVKIVRQGTLDLFRIGVCEGEVPPLETPTTQAYPENPNSKDGSANVHKGWRLFKVKE